MNRVMVATILAAATLLVMVPVASTVPGQGMVYIPISTPTTGSTNYFPFHFDAEWRYQVIVNAQYLPTKPFKVLNVAIVARSHSTFTAPQCQIRMCNTNLVDFQATANRNFNNNLGPCPTLVLNGPIQFSGTTNQWTNLGPPHSHGYDGKRNLLIEIRYTGGSRNLPLAMTTVPTAVRRMWAYGPGAYNATTGSVDPAKVSGAPKLCLTIDYTCVLFCPDTVRLGTGTPIHLLNAQGGDYYQMAASQGQSPLNLGKCKISLMPDNVFFLSVVVGPPIFRDYAGVVSAAGQASGTLTLPQIPQLVGLCLYHAAVTYNRAGITGCSNTGGTLIVR